MRTFVAVAAMVSLLAACDRDITDSVSPGRVSLDAELRQALAQWGVTPVGAMAAQDPALVRLGQALFFDPILSGNRDIACATCHDPETATSDGLSLAVGTGAVVSGGTRLPGIGGEFVPRRSPSLFNVVLGPFYLFWDARLEDHLGVSVHIHPGLLPLPMATDPLAVLALLPVLDRREMRGEAGDRDVLGQPNELAAFADNEPTRIWEALMERLLGNAEYADLFAEAFPGRPTDQLRFQHAGEALAAFQREAFAKTRSAFDRYLERSDGALSTQQKRGALLFFREAGCASCHSGPLLGGRGFGNVGAPQIGPGVGRSKPLDLGAGELRNNEFYRFAFRIPPLRNVELSAAYMHSGAYRTLEAVVRHYDNVPRALQNYDAGQLDPAIRHLYRGDPATIAQVLATLEPRLRSPLDLSENQIQELVAFLGSLTDPAARDLRHLVPDRVPSGLPVGGGERPH